MADNVGKNIVAYGFYAGAYYDEIIPTFTKSTLSMTTTGITFRGESGNAGYDFQDMAYVSWNVNNNILRVSGRNTFIEDNPNASVKYSGNCVYFSLDFYLVE